MGASRDLKSLLFEVKDGSSVNGPKGCVIVDFPTYSVHVKENLVPGI
jgi:hypothetical protein